MLVTSLLLAIAALKSGRLNRASSIRNRPFSLVQGGLFLFVLVQRNNNRND
jgi:hypothetical protein